MQPNQPRGTLSLLALALAAQYAMAHQVSFTVWLRSLHKQPERRMRALSSEHALRRGEHGTLQCAQ